MTIRRAFRMPVSRTSLAALSRRAGPRQALVTTSQNEMPLNIYCRASFDLDAGPPSGMSRDLRQFYKFGKKIVGAGVNYKSLITERNVPIPKEPILFLKPTTTYISDGQNIEIPPGYKVDHEVELGVIIGKKCRNVRAEDADKYIAGYCLALDLTATNVLKEARDKGLPWCTGKGFDTATPVSPAIDKRLLPCPDDVRLWCTVNGQIRQDCSTSDMVFSVKELISFASRNMTLEPDDLILTGSPAGVGSIVPGDTVEAGLGKDLITVCFKVNP